MLEAKTFPAEPERDASALAAEYLRALQERTIATLRRRPETGLEIVDVSESTSSSNALRSISARFEIFVDAEDPRVSERTIESITDNYLESHGETVIAPPVSAGELEAARMDVAMARGEYERLEQELDIFEQVNAAVLPDLEELRAQEVEESERQSALLDQQILTLEARRSELDRGLAEMQRGASQFNTTGDPPVTSEILMAAQARWAVLRGFYGVDHVPAMELGAAITQFRTAADRRLESITAELEDVRGRFNSLQRRQPIDHPDVIALAHRVSALERLVDQTTVAGLSNRELGYIENLGRERRDIDSEIDGARDQRAALDEQRAADAQRMDQVPVLQERHQVLKQEIADAQRRFEDADARYAALQAELEAASRERPGELTVVAIAEPQRLALSQPASVAGLACLLCLPLFLFTLRLIERRHRTVHGANAVAHIQGQPPLAAIPELGSA